MAKFLFALAVAAAPADALAQGFFQQLFGFGPGPAMRPAHRTGVSPARERSVSSETRETSASHSRGDGDSGGRKYRTLCVRLCDGYYFPISNATTHQTFLRDANRCEASCGAEARLFYLPSDSSDTDAMTDLTGLSYAGLPNAFRYRKSLVSGCSCKPMPWSEAARARHRGYAVAEARARGDTLQAAADNDEPASSRRSYELPPPLSGPGVMVISAAGVATMAEVAPASPVAADADGVSDPAPATATERAPAEASPVWQAEARPRGRSKAAHPRVTIINASEPSRHRRARHVAVAVKSAGLFGSGLFAAEPRRIVYPGQRVRIQYAR